ncbi:MAG: IS1 family transposase [Bdellovibrio sp.]|nr:IS1 family transposase [Bdellovibrio sp.]
MSIKCPYCQQQNPSSESREVITSHGSFFRKSDTAKVCRFLCKPCGKHFSLATFSPCYRQKKRHLNQRLFEQLVSGVSQRRAAFLLKVNRKTIVRKFIFLGLASYHYLQEDRMQHPPAVEIEFDDLETFEHSKLKPLSVIAAVESGTRRILGFRVARMPAKGLLVRRSLKKYGFRKDERKEKRRALFSEIKPHICEHSLLKSDESPHYPSDVKKFFPLATHMPFKGQRGCVVGQGELKGRGYDPLFSLNHSYAMFRANVNRIFRRTWNTTKKPERLALHLAMYSLYHNLFIIHHPAR